MRTHHRRATVTLIPEKVAHLATDDFSNILQCVYCWISRDGKIQALAADARLSGSKTSKGDSHNVKD